MLWYIYNKNSWLRLFWGLYVLWLDAASPCRVERIELICLRCALCTRDLNWPASFSKSNYADSKIQTFNRSATDDDFHRSGSRVYECILPKSLRPIADSWTDDGFRCDGSFSTYGLKYSLVWWNGCRWLLSWLWLQRGWVFLSGIACMPVYFFF